MDQTGTIFTFTRLFVAAEQFNDRVPFYCAIVKGGDGTRFPAFIIDVGENEVVDIGKTVRFHSYDQNGQMQYVLIEN